MKIALASTNPPDTTVDSVQLTPSPLIKLLYWGRFIFNKRVTLRERIHALSFAVIEVTQLARGDLESMRRLRAYSVQLVRREFNRQSLYMAIYNTTWGLYSTSLFDEMIFYGDMGIAAAREWFGDNSEAECNLVDRMGHACREMGQLGRCVDYFRSALRIGKCVYGERHWKVGNLYNSLGNVHMYLGETEAAYDYLKEGWKLMEANGVENAKAVGCLESLAEVSHRLDKNPSDILAMFKKVAEMREKLPNSSPYDKARTLTRMANVHRDEGELDEAIRCYKEAARIFDAHGDDNLTAAYFFSDMGNYYLRVKDFEATIIMCSNANRVNTAHGHDQALQSRIYGQLAEAHAQLGRFDLSIELSRKKLALVETLFGADDQIQITKSFIESVQRAKEKYMK